MNHMGGVMVSMLTSSAADRGFEPWSCQTKEYKIGIYCLSAKHAAFYFFVLFSVINLQLYPRQHDLLLKYELKNNINYVQTVYSPLTFSETLRREERNCIL